MELVKFLTTVSDAQLMELIGQLAGYGITLIVILLLVVLLYNAARWQRKTIRYTTNIR